MARATYSLRLKKERNENMHVYINNNMNIKIKIKIKIKTTNIISSNLFEQTRTGKRTARASVRIAVEMVKENMLTERYDIDQNQIIIDY